MQESSKIVVARIVNSRRPRLILDAPCGNGWLREKISYDATLDGIDLYNLPEGNYRAIISSNLDLGLPAELPRYDCIVSCEGIEHFGNPSLFIKTLWDHLEEGGFIVITTPNVWYPASRLQFLVRGFFPSFPALTGRTRRGEHMHIMPWSYPQLHCYLKAGDFKNIEVHLEPLSRPKHLYERFVAYPQKVYCAKKLKNSMDEEERKFWHNAISPSSLYGRHLIITAEK